MARRPLSVTMYRYDGQTHNLADGEGSDPSPCAPAPGILVDNFTGQAYHSSTRWVGAYTNTPGDAAKATWLNTNSAIGRCSIRCGAAGPKGRPERERFQRASFPRTTKHLSGRNRSGNCGSQCNLSKTGLTLDTKRLVVAFIVGAELERSPCRNDRRRRPRIETKSHRGPGRATLCQREGQS